MDEIDVNLMDAWQRVCERARRDPEFVATRAAMAQREIVRRPMRAWCLCLRAADLRINEMNFALLSRYAWADKEAHLVDLCGEAVREVCQPISIPWAGVRISEFAARFGVGPSVVNRWIRNGEVGVRYEKPWANEGWRPVPYVWTHGAVDPNRMKGMEIEDVWGSLWRTLWKRVPLSFHQTVLRVPRYRQLTGKGSRGDGRKFFGWNWECPGTLDEHGKQRRCGRIVHRLYAAVPVSRVQDFLGEKSPIELPNLREAAGSIGYEGEALRFACKACTGWVSVHSTNPRDAWNEFVRHLSGGLLIGSDVEQPARFAGFKRKKAAGQDRSISFEQAWHRAAEKEAGVEQMGVEQAGAEVIEIDAAVDQADGDAMTDVA